MEKISGLRVYITTIVGAACWGLIGLFISPLYAHGFTAWDVVAIRSIFTFVILILLMAAFYRDQLRTRLKDHIFLLVREFLASLFLIFFILKFFLNRVYLLQ